MVNKDYLLSCDDGQEENLVELANHLDTKYSELKKNLGNIGENKLLLITSIQIIDDYFDLLQKVNSKKEDFNDLSNKFKELRSLAIEYKDSKEVEIGKLREEITEFKNAAEDNKRSYEEILDKATQSIEKFIRKGQLISYLKYKPKIILLGKYHEKNRNFLLKIFGTLNKACLPQIS